MHPVEMLLKEIREEDWAMTLSDAGPRRSRQVPAPKLLRSLATVPLAAVARVRMLAQELRNARGAASSAGSETAIVLPSSVSGTGFPRLSRLRSTVAMIEQGREQRVCTEWHAPACGQSA